MTEQQSEEELVLTASGKFNWYSNEMGLLTAILLVVGLTMLLDDAYLSKPVDNIQELLRQTSLLGIFALGAAIVIISGGIDLSSGSVIAFSAVVCASILYALAPLDANGIPVVKELPIWNLVVAVLGTLLVALLIGSLHAWLITVIDLPPFVATLASLVGLRSLALLLSHDVHHFVSDRGDQTQIYIYDENFRMLTKSWWIPVLVFLLLGFFTWVLMTKTVTGRHLYAMGGNEEAARLSGIRTDLLKWLAYCYGTVTASIAGILYASYVGMSDPATQGVGYELDAIAAAVVGGCSLTGGIGTVLGVVLGSLFLRVVIDSVAKIVNSNPSDVRGLIVGLLVVLAVALNQLKDSGGMKKKFFPGALGIVNLFIISGLSGIIFLVMTDDPSMKVSAGLVGGTLALVILGLKLIDEHRQK